MQEITNFLAGLQVPLPSRANVVIRWPQLAAMAAIGIVYFAFSLKRFRKAIFGG